MDLNPSDEQQQLIDAFCAFYTKESPGERVRAVEPLGHDPELWSRLRELGALDMAVDEGAGGWGASLLDLALVAEQHGRHVAPAPLVEAQVAARLLSRADTAPAGEALGRALAGGLTTVALHPPRAGVLTLVPSGAVADEVVFVDGGRLWCMTIGDGARPVANIGSMPVADVTVDGAAEMASGDAAAALFELALDEWLVLMANAMVGLGSRALEMGVEYTRERHAFGVPIGSFQAVAHGLADAATALEGGRLLAREAAWSAGEDPGRRRQLAALACGFATDAARQASDRSLHYHGGYGFMLEYDVQLYFRRATAWPAVFGEPATMYARGSAERLLSAGGEG
jgi:alkylation response protein AidB-like acyl-CoA dehydrogenase